MIGWAAVQYAKKLEGEKEDSVPEDVIIKLTTGEWKNV
jgi:hypothetical protein